MIEKSFDKTYEMRGSQGISQSALTRAANRLIAEYKEAFGAWGVPDEIKKIADKIKKCEDSDTYEDEGTNEYCGTGERDYDTVKYTHEARVHAFWDTDEWNEPVYCVNWYFFSSEYYTKRIGKQTLHASSFSDILRKATAAKGKYRYFCTHRSPSPGVIPEGFVSYDTYSQGMRYIGEVTYNEKPLGEELRNWGLIPDTGWEQLRKAYAGVEEC